MIKKQLWSPNRTFIIAEISANHGQELSNAIKLIKIAKDCGADAVKFQVYTPDTLTINSDNEYFQIKHPEWGGQTLYELYKKAFTPWEWFKELKRTADELGIFFFASAFDKTSVDFLEDIDVQLHKISSFEMVDLTLIEYAANTDKPLIISTGMGTKEEIQEAVCAAKRGGCTELALMKCVSSYPAKPEDMNLATIEYMKKMFCCPVGLSDHTLGIGVPIAAITQGAQLIEKHITLSREHKTADSFFSLEPQELKQLVEEIRVVEKSIGSVKFGNTQSEEKSKIFRRSLFVVKDIKEGDEFTEENVRSIRPSNGLAPKYIDSVMGKRASKSVKKGEPLSWDIVEN